MIWTIYGISARPRTCQIDDISQNIASLLSEHLFRIVKMNDNRFVIKAIAEINDNQNHFTWPDFRIQHLLKWIDGKICHSKSNSAEIHSMCDDFVRGGITILWTIAWVFVAALMEII